MGARRIIHLDMDAFYASVEVLDNPELKGKPVIVGGTSNRGVVSAASYEARKFGVHSAMPIVTARKLCPEGVFLPGRMSRYHELSEQIQAIFHRFTPLVEPISLDEAFLDVTASEKLFGPAEEIAVRIRKIVREETGLTVSAGVASSKLVAKIASDLNKPDGLTIVPPGEERAFLDPLPIGRLWGVGRATKQEFGLLGVHTIGDLGRLSPELLTRKFGKHGIQLHYAALGLDERAVEPEREAKSIGNEETFETDLTHNKDMHRELLALCNKVGRRLRRHAVDGKTITLKVKYNDFKQITRSVTLHEPTCDHRQIYREICALLAKTDAGKKPVRLLGVSLANLSPATAARQIPLFANKNMVRKRRELDEALDYIAEKFGTSAVRPGTLVEEDEQPE